MDELFHLQIFFFNYYCLIFQIPVYQCVILLIGMNKKDQSKSWWVTSKEAMKLAKIKNGNLMHYREDGKLEYTKKGNVFYYSLESIKKIKLKSNKK